MDKRIRAMFDSVHMSESCARRIGDALTRGGEEEDVFMRKLELREKPKKLWPAAVLGALLVLVLVLQPGADPEEMAPATTEPTVEISSATTEATVEILSEEERERRFLERHGKLTGGDLQKTIERFESALEYTEGKIRYRIIRGGQDVTVLYDEKDHTPFTEVVDGRVYFVSNGESLDITEKFSEEEPFTYIYTDRMFMEHYIAIGGTAENPGWLEMMYTSWEEKPASFVHGTGINTWNNAADERYGWETRAKEIFEEYDVHWPS